MKGTAAAILAGMTLVGGTTVAALQEQSTQDEYGSMSQTQDEYGSTAQTQDEYGTATQTQDEYGSTTQTQDEYGTEPETTDPYGDAEARTGDQPTGDPDMGTLPEAETTGEPETTYGAEIGDEGAHDMSMMTSEELSGTTVVTTEGEEIGTIEQIGYSSMHQEKVATVNVGGFLGVGDKVIAIPLSELGMGDTVQTTMTRDEIQAAQEFDPSNLSTGEQPQQYEQQQQPYEQQQ